MTHIRRTYRKPVLTTGLALGFISFTLALPCAAAPVPDTLRPDQIKTIETATAKAMAGQQIPSVVVMIDRGGKRVYARAWGLRNVGDNLPANVDTQYQYGSITKQFTAMSILLLAQDGKLSLGDSIGKYLPAFAGKNVTVRELLIHASGLGDPVASFDYDMFVAPLLARGHDWVMNESAKMPLSFPPGTKAHYDNAGYVALARIVERAGGMPFDKFLQTRILDAAGMKVAHPFRYLTIRKNLALGYTRWNKESIAFFPNGEGQGGEPGLLVNAPVWNMRQVDGAGYLVGDAADLQRWDDALLAGKLLHGKWRALFYTPGKLADGSPAAVGVENKSGRATGYYCYGGLGKFELDGHVLYGANGGTFGFTLFTGTIPDKNISMTVLTNLGGAANDKITIPIAEALLR